MTPTDLAETILRDVRRYDPSWNRSMMDDANDGDWVTYGEVLAALTAALDPALSERAGEVLEGVTPGKWIANGASVNTKPDESAVAVCVSMGTRSREEAEANARFIAWTSEGVPALLAQNAALRARVERLEAVAKDATDASKGWRDRAEAAEAQIAAISPTDAPDLADPVTVHANMLRGTIAKPTVEQIIHLYGRDALLNALSPAPDAREAALRSLASFVSGMDESTFFSFASDMDRAFETHRATEASGRILALISEART